MRAFLMPSICARLARLPPRIPQSVDLSLNGNAVPRAGQGNVRFYDLRKDWAKLGSVVPLSPRQFHARTVDPTERRRISPLSCISDNGFASSEYAPTVATIKPHLILATCNAQIRFADWPPSGTAFRAKAHPAASLSHGGPSMTLFASIDLHFADLSARMALADEKMTLG